MWCIKLTITFLHILAGNFNRMSFPLQAALCVSSSLTSPHVYTWVSQPAADTSGLGHRPTWMFTHRCPFLEPGHFDTVSPVDALLCQWPSSSLRLVIGHGLSTVRQLEHWLMTNWTLRYTVVKEIFNQNMNIFFEKHVAETILLPGHTRLFGSKCVKDKWMVMPGLRAVIQKVQTRRSVWDHIACSQDSFRSLTRQSHLAASGVLYKLKFHSSMPHGCEALVVYIHIAAGELS